MNYSLSTLWHERPRFLPGIGAVCFSAVLIALQCGLLLGLFKITSIPVDNTRADVWVCSENALSIDLGRPIPLTRISRFAGDARVEKYETYYQAYASWIKPDGGSALCIIIGSNLDDGNLGSIAELKPEMRAALTEPNAIVVDRSAMSELGVKRAGDYGEINKVRVRVVGFTDGLKSLAGPYVFCNRATAKHLLRNMTPRDTTTYYLIRCTGRDGDASKAARAANAKSLAHDLNTEYEGRHDMTVMTADDFSTKSRLHWLMKTKAGIALGYTALLGLLVGAVVTSQTLYAATTASAKEYAILLAMGIPRRKVTLTVIVQSFWVGLFGIVVAYPTVHLLAELGKLANVVIPLPWTLLGLAAAVTMVMSMLAGLIALRSVRKIEPMSLLR